MEDKIINLLKFYSEGLRNIYGSSLKAVVLYGSYARGDFHEGSDIDVMLLLSMDQESVSRYFDQLVRYTYDFNTEHDVEINPIDISEEQFNKWNSVYPFYGSIKREGVSVYGAA